MLSTCHKSINTYFSYLTMASDNDSNSTIGDFHSRALSSFYNQLLLHSNDVGTNAGKISYSNDVTNAQRREEEEEAEVESFAQYLVEDDTPKIDSAVKAYLSLVVARSAVQSEIDVISTSPLSSLLVSSSSSREVAAGAADGVTTNDEEGSRECCCTFAGNGDANRCALFCARTLLSAINSTILPSLESDVSSEGDDIDDTNADNETRRKMKQRQKLQSDTTRIIWNKLAKNASSLSPSGDKLANTTNVVSISMKPSKVLGRQSLLVAYPYIQERFRRGGMTLTDAKNVISTKTIPSSLDNDSTNDNIMTASTTITADTTTTNTPFHLPLQSLSNEILPPVLPPKGINVDQWKAFYTEFGQLLLIASSSSSSSTLSSAVVMGTGKRPNDSALLWAKDGGAAELQSRRESRTRRAAEALSGSGRAGADLTIDNE